MNDGIDEDIYGTEPLTFDGDMPQPSRVVSAPDDLDSFIKANLRGMSRISVRKHLGGRKYGHVNAVVTGAGHDELPRATTSQISRAVMAIAADDQEKTSETCRYMCQGLIYKKATGDPKKLAVIIEVGSSGAWDQDYSVAVQAPEHADQMFLGHINQLHGEVLNMAKVIASLGTAALANVSEVFIAKENAMVARADADRVALEAERSTEAEKNKQKNWQQMFGLAKQAVGAGVVQYMAGQAANKLGGPIAPQAAVAAAPLAPQPTDTPDWARAAAGEAVELPVPGMVERLDEDELELGFDEERDLDDELEDDDMQSSILDPHEHGLSACASSLYRSITVRQWPKLMGTLSKGQMNLLLKLEDPESDAEVRKAIAKFTKSIKPLQTVAMIGILTSEQSAALMSMRSVEE